MQLPTLVVTSRLGVRALVALALVGLAPRGASAQITLGTDWLVAPGDVATVHSDARYRDAAGNVARAGGNQRWDFGTPGRTGESTFIAREPRAGQFADSFPRADVLLNSSSRLGLAADDSEIYLRRVGGRLEIVGIASSDTSDFLPVFRLTDPLLFQEAPLTFGARGSDQTRARFAFPPELLGLLLGDTTSVALIDSVGVSVGQDVAYEVDGWGEVVLLGQTRPCLRMRTVTEAFQEFEIKLPFIGWIPISGLIQLPDSLTGGVIPRTVDYSWLVADSPYPLTRVTVDSLGAATNLDYIASFSVDAPEREPAGVPLTLRRDGERLLVDLPDGPMPAARLEVYGTDGRLLAGLALGGGALGAPAEFDTAAWPRGAYLVALWSEGRLVGTGKAMVP